MPTLLELIASTGVSAINRKSRAERSGVFDDFITEENLLKNYRLVGISKRRRSRVLSGKDSRGHVAAYVITRRGALEANLDA